MKSFKFYAMLMSMAVGMASFSACSSDDDDKNSSEEVTETTGTVSSFNQVEFLQNNIVEIDSLGNIIQRVNGAMLNSSDTTELFIGVESVEEAAAIFKSWLSPDAEVNVMTPSLTDLQIALKDDNGNVKVSVYFKTIEDAGEDLAEVTFSSDNVMKYVSRIVFKKKTAWPENATTISPYELGDVVLHETAVRRLDSMNEGEQYMVCIREAEMGQSGLLLYISGLSYKDDTVENMYQASLSNAKTASSILQKDFNFFVEAFKKCNRTLDKDAYYWIDKYWYFVFYFKKYAIRLSDGHIDWFSTAYKKYEKNDIQVYNFGIIKIE